MTVRLTAILCATICATMYETTSARPGSPGFEIIVEATWLEADGGNGHTYLGVKMAEGLTWAEAKVVAEDLGGHLATLTTAAENDWVYANIASEPCLWNAEAGPYIGGFHNHESEDYSEPGEGWEWVTGEAWGSENWDSAQPDNAPPGEDFLHFWNPSAAQCPACDATPPCGPNNAWNDIYPTVIWLDTLIVESAFAPCTADLNGDNIVGASDLLILLGFWGPCAPVCLGDLDGDRNVGASDLLALLANWGPCP